MSFPKAKLKRFNEVTSCTPSPADYNTAKISRSNRGGSLRSAKTDHSDNESVQSDGSTYFKTPTIIKKKKLFTLSSKSRLNLFKNENSDKLKEKTVECNRKDAAINDLTEQIEDLKFQINNLNRQKEILIAEQNQFEETTKELNDKHISYLRDLTLDHNDVKRKISEEINDMVLEIACLKEECENGKQNVMFNLNKASADITTNEINFNLSLNDCKQRIIMLDDELKSKENELNDLKENLIVLENEFVNEKEKAQSEHEKRVENLYIDMLKKTAEINNEIESNKKNHFKQLAEMENDKLRQVERLKENHKTEIDVITNENETIKSKLENDFKKVNYLLEDEANNRFEDIELNFMLKLQNQQEQFQEIFKECQAISEYTIKQCVIEKEEITEELANLIDELDELKIQNVNYKIKSECKKLELKINEANRLLEDELQNLQCQKLNYDAEVKRVQNEKRKYKITIDKTHETIEAIKKRIYESDRDVEQLKLELENCKMSKSELEEKTGILRRELEDLTDMQGDIEIQQHSTLQLLENDLKLKQQKMFDEIEEYKESVNNVIVKYEEKLQEKEDEINDIKEHLHKQEDMNSEAYHLIHLANVEIEQLEKHNDNLQEEIESLKEKVAETNKRYTKIERSKKEFEGKLDESINANLRLKQELDRAQMKYEEVELLAKQINQLQEKSASYHEYCEYYKSKSNALEKEIDEMNEINRKYIEQTKKYEELITKMEELEEKNEQLESKIKRMKSSTKQFKDESNAGDKEKMKDAAELSQENLCLFKDNRSLEATIEDQARIIERLRKELEGKAKSKQQAENYHSPLRERN